MRGLRGLLAGMCLWLGVCAAAGAQTYKVGECGDWVQNAKLDVVETWNPSPAGVIRVSQLVKPGAPGMAPQVYNMALDPSGMHLFAISSAAPGVQFWLSRDSRLLAITPTSVQQVGACVLNQTYVANLPRPTLLPIGQMAPITFAYNPQVGTPIMSSVANYMAATPGIPFGIYTPGTYQGIPPLMSAKQASDCLVQAGSDTDAFYSCAVGQYMGQRERAAYDCVRNAQDQTEAAFCLMNNRLPGGTQQAVNDVADCYSQYGNNLSAYPVCMVGKNADPKTAQLVNCMAQQVQQGQQPDYWTLGMCAFGPQLFDPNPETAIAIQCAIATKGQPQAFVACTGGQLMQRELDKCLDYGVGTEKGCFGPNNTITQAYDRIDNEIKNALGAKSVAYLAWQAARLSMDPYKMAEATRNVTRELDKARANTNAAIAKAAQQAADVVAKATPDVTIGQSSSGLPSVTVKGWKL